MNRKRILSLLLVLMLLLSACQPAVQAPPKETEKVEEKAETEVKEEPKEEPKEESKEEPKEAAEGETTKFVDSVGREVEIPVKLERVAPSGHLAQMIMYSINPDQLVGWGRLPNKAAQKFIPQKYLDLPEFGAFYGAKADLNVESLLAAKPQIVIDLGQIKGDKMAEELDDLQKQIGVPVIFIEAELDTMVDAYEKLGKILGQEDKAKALAEYVKSTLAMAKENVAKLTEDQKVKVYYGEGETGLQTNPPQSIHAEVLNLVGAINVSDIPQTSGAGMNEISMEQLLGWDPDIVVFGPNSVYDKVSEDPLWADVRAVKEGKIYEVPMGPYNWMGRPPAVNRILGIKWLGNLLYPEVFDYDMKAETKEFYKLFYNYDLTDEEVTELLSKSTLK